MPAHVLIHPDHGLTLVDWCYAVPTGAPLRAIPTPTAICTRSSCFRNGASRPGLDIFMAAQCMVLLLGGDPKTGILPETINPRLRTFFSSWWRFGPDQVPGRRRSAGGIHRAGGLALAARIPPVLDAAARHLRHSSKRRLHHGFREMGRTHLRFADQQVGFHLPSGGHTGGRGQLATA